MTDIICPFCGQDRVWRVALGDDPEGSFPHAFCFECDTFWEDGDFINDKTGKTFKFFMRDRGQETDYSLIRKGKPAILAD